ncbi:DUF4253 domain-containing protein [Aneurinibacillus uraniidurans]|uniref:DUF4253 domain-containing protein n=1 Tax=Aneurinibacillus uraniidurans TaxID=2966586 RepID=UPI00234B9CC1|nr:DUF4253 domain-containing protein [Aneurinibacillus sp. B1]WCN39626.1 DUF4253 domain-containing protein [Aneurinibacillus sp. B1]
MIISGTLLQGTTSDTLDTNQKHEYTKSANISKDKNTIRKKARNLQEAKMLLQTLTKRSVRSYSTWDFGREKDTSCISVLVKEKDAINILHAIRTQLDPGMIAFIGTKTTQWFENKEKETEVEIVVGKGDDPFDILRIARTDAINYGMKTEDLIKKLRNLVKDNKIDIIAAETDTVELELVDMPYDLHAFCQELYSLCPDIVDQGIGSIEDLEASMRKDKKIYLWWD